MDVKLGKNGDGELNTFIGGIQQIKRSQGKDISEELNFGFAFFSQSINTQNLPYILIISRSCLAAHQLRGIEAFP
jgi:hypothetical protein